ncbi:hypothetical protein HYALB_00002762 [Hymenoscyphus albidus]|uniref:Uncharacterized protein n=1 Tax=Hymenoscyphus albidus TaxID=595503 RepID=A0A9N9LK99_9HELO|nr:hypothetical protein HYALB_00002762 [Hymenoscyphus albidus]
MREVVQHGRASKMSITKQTGFKPFAGDLGMLPVLSMVAKFCRNGEIRRDTIELMQLEPRRTGIFDSMLSVNILEWLIEKEEKGADEYGFIPEESRVRILRIDTLDEENCSTGEREVTIVYGMRDGSSDRKVLSKGGATKVAEERTGHLLSGLGMNEAGTHSTTA